MKHTFSKKLLLNNYCNICFLTSWLPLASVNSSCVLSYSHLVLQNAWRSDLKHKKDFKYNQFFRCLIYQFLYISYLNFEFYNYNVGIVVERSNLAGNCLDDYREIEKKNICLLM